MTGRAWTSADKLLAALDGAVYAIDDASPRDLRTAIRAARGRYSGHGEPMQRRAIWRRLARVLRAVLAAD